jgi:quinohemoprotein ethanol dehydrogenase
VRKEARSSFLKKRSKRLSTGCRGLSGSARHKAKVFCFFFLKKKTFLLLSTLITHPCAATPPAFGDVTPARLAHADREPQNWFTNGRDGDLNYYSPLAQINDRNVGQLGFAWEYRTGTSRGLEATPIVVDGIMYTAGNWGIVYALDAATGRLLWRFDPHNDGQAGRYACCDVVNRGVAVWQGRVYVASLDGRLFALDAATGGQLWAADTITNHTLPYTITGAPQIAGDLVVIGNGGADMSVGGVRGYVSAYDLKTGHLAWRFYTVPLPGDPPGQPDALRAAAKTWDPKRNPKYWGGGTVWDGMAYDPALNLIYIGVGNSSPYQKYDRSPGGGDNLYLSSIVALNAHTGQLAWYYQTTPADQWDYTATQKLVLADMKIGGRLRKIIMQAPKNGYFYVLDRATGAVISASPYTYINWSDGLDANFRPIVSKRALYAEAPKLVYPSWGGGHDWQPMSFSPKTGLVYIPVLESPNIVVDLKHNPGSLVHYVDGAFGTGMIIPDMDFTLPGAEDFVGKLPAFSKIDPKTGKSVVQAVLKAWDPAHQRMVWQRSLSSDYFMFDGGTMSTGGNLVFEGLANGQFRAYAADTGAILKSLDTGSGIMAAPDTYEVNGVQYVAVMAGYGGATIGSPFPAHSAPAKYLNDGRIIVFKLGGGAVPKPPERTAETFPPPPAHAAPAAEIRAGQKLFTTECARCHQFGDGIVPDLRSVDINLAGFRRVVLGGVLASQGMGRFDDVLTAQDCAAIYAYVGALRAAAGK